MSGTEFVYVCVECEIEWKKNSHPLPVSNMSINLNTPCNQWCVRIRAKMTYAVYTINRKLMCALLQSNMSVRTSVRAKECWTANHTVWAIYCLTEIRTSAIRSLIDRNTIKTNSPPRELHIHIKCICNSLSLIHSISLFFSHPLSRYSFILLQTNEISFTISPNEIESVLLCVSAKQVAWLI